MLFHKRSKNKGQKITLKRMHLMTFLSGIGSLLLLIFGLYFGQDPSIPDYVSALIVIAFAIIIYAIVNLSYLDLAGVSRLDPEDELAVINLHKAEKYSIKALWTIGILVSLIFNFSEFQFMVDGELFFTMLLIFYAGYTTMRSGFFLLIEGRYSKGLDESED